MSQTIYFLPVPNKSEKGRSSENADVTIDVIEIANNKTPSCLQTRRCKHSPVGKWTFPFPHGKIKPLQWVTHNTEEL